MLPRLAAFAPERFARMHLEPCTAFLLSVLKNPPERGAGVTLHLTKLQIVTINTHLRMSCCCSICSLMQ